jgi:hypothetical protein
MQTSRKEAISRLWHPIKDLCPFGVEDELLAILVKLNKYLYPNLLLILISVYSYLILDVKLPQIKLI